MWAYKCDQNLSGLNKHANYAAVKINFWISPDDANIDPESGGLVVYKDEAPLVGISAATTLIRNQSIIITTKKAAVALPCRTVPIGR